MASVISEQRGKRVLYRIQFRNRDGRRKSIRLSQSSKRTADAIRSKIESLNHCQISGEAPSPALAEWVASLGDELHGKLATAGLVGPRQQSSLGSFLEKASSAADRRTQPRALSATSDSWNVALSLFSAATAR